MRARQGANLRHIAICVSQGWQRWLSRDRTARRAPGTRETVSQRVAAARFTGLLGGISRLVRCFLFPSLTRTEDKSTWYFMSDGVASRVQAISPSERSGKELEACTAFTTS